MLTSGVAIKGDLALFVYVFQAKRTIRRGEKSEKYKHYRIRVSGSPMLEQHKVYVYVSCTYENRMAEQLLGDQ